MRLLPQPIVATLKAYAEVPPEQRPPDTNTWSPIPVWDAERNGTGGTAVKTVLGPVEIKFCKDRNAQTPIFWQWADQPKGTIYWGQDWKTDNTTGWAHCLQASSVRIGWRNKVLYDAISDDGKLLRVVGIPRSLDYSAWLNDTLFCQQAFTQDGYYACHGSPVYVPVFNGGFKVLNGKQEIWFERLWVSEELGPLEPSPIIIPAGTVTIAYRGPLKNLNIRPEPTMNNSSSGYLYPGALVPLQEILENAEGVWGKINEMMFIALYLNSTRLYYTDWRQ